MAARRAAGIALSEAENSLERLLTEPRHDTPAGEYALQLITYGRRAAGALTAVDTYSARDLTREAPLGPELAQTLETFLVGTLHQASAFARGLKPDADAPLPELPAGLDSARATLRSRDCYAGRACSASCRAAASTVSRASQISAA